MLRQPQICVAIWILHGRGSEGIEAASRPPAGTVGSARAGPAAHAHASLHALSRTRHSDGAEAELVAVSFSLLSRPGRDLARANPILALSLSLLVVADLLHTAHGSSTRRLPASSH